MPIDDSFHNTYLFPKYPGHNPFGVPGRLQKGHIFALSAPAVTTTPGSNDSGGRNENDDSNPTDAPGTDTVADLGVWSGFPSNLRMEWLDQNTIEDVSGNYYEDNWVLVGTTSIFFPQNEEGEWCDLNGEPMPPISDDEDESSSKAAWYGSVLDSIPQWRSFADKSGAVFIWHTYASNGGVGYIESYETHTNTAESERPMHLVEQNTGPTSLGGGVGPRGAPGAMQAQRRQRQIDWTRFKTFQFNPPAWEFDYQMVGTAPTATTQTGGTDAGRAPGYVSTSVKLSFDRTQEVYAATMGTNPNVDPIFAKVGVQQDVFEIFKIMMNPADYEAAIAPLAEEAAQTSAIAQISNNIFRGGASPVSMNDMNQAMFDIGLSGAQIAFSPVAVVFNDYFTIQGWVTGLNVAYAAFNNKLVPTIASVTMDIEVLNVAQIDASTNLNPSGTQLNPTPTSLSPSVPSASGGSTGRARVVTRESLNNGATIYRRGNSTYSAT
jgi:hypothetical protein